MTRRDLAVALLTAALVGAASFYGGPLAGKVAETVAPVVVERVVERVAPAETPDGPRLVVPGEPIPPGYGVIMQPIRERSSSAADRQGVSPVANRRGGAKGRIPSPASPDLAYYRALHRAGLFPVTRHEARP